MRSNHMHDADSAESYHNLLLTTFNIFEPLETINN